LNISNASGSLEEEIEKKEKEKRFDSYIEVNENDQITSSTFFGCLCCFGVLSAIIIIIIIIIKLTKK
jgi:hypothetical protein